MIDDISDPAGEGAYQVEAQAPAGGEGELTFILPFDEKELENFLLKIGRPRRAWSRGHIPQPARPALDFGIKLFTLGTSSVTASSTLLEVISKMVERLWVVGGAAAYNPQQTYFL